MQAKISLFAIALFYNFICLGQVGENRKASSELKKLFVSFSIDDSNVNIKDNFSLIFINGSDTIKTRVKGNHIIVPNQIKDLQYIVIFKYKKSILSFKKISKKMIFPGQDVTWRFGIDNRPFNDSLSLLKPEEYRTDKSTKQLQYLQFDLMEYGDGIQFVKKIEHLPGKMSSRKGSLLK